MQPHGHHNSQRAWQRRAWQYATYAFWPLLFLWLFSAYPSSSPQGNIQRHHPAGACAPAYVAMLHWSAGIGEGHVAALLVRPCSGPGACGRRRAWLVGAPSLRASAQRAPSTVPPHTTCLPALAPWPSAVVNPGSLHGSSSSSSSVEQPVELSDTADTDWEPPKVQPTTQQQQQQVEPAGGGGGSQAQPGDDPNRVYSSASVFAVSGWLGARVWGTWVHEACSCPATRLAA